MINSNANNLDNFEVKTGTSDVDYPNLFRGLSTFEIDSYNTVLDQKPEPGNLDANNLNSEKTYADLSDLLLRDQTYNITNKQEDTKELKIITQFTPVLLDSSQKMSLNDSLMSEESLDTSTSSNSGYDSMHKRAQNVRVKRLSTTSTTPSTSGLVEPPVKPRRGRKPTSLHDSANSTIKLTKKQALLKESEQPVVCFGNKVVVKETDEYFKRRESNNVAVKKCREKTTQKQQERESRMRDLDEENKKLTNTVDTLHKELNVLKNIIITMSPDKKLPEHIQTLLKNIDN